MSANLTKAIISGKVLVKKRISGEVAIAFHTGKPPVHINTDAIVDIQKEYPGVTLYDLQRSNLNDLIKRRAIDIILDIP